MRLLVCPSYLVLAFLAFIENINKRFLKNKIKNLDEISNNLTSKVETQEINFHPHKNSTIQKGEKDNINRPSSIQYLSNFLLNKTFLQSEQKVLDNGRYLLGAFSGNGA
uniref:Uncharacterized protein n=1 Tax=Salix viminalis TaxID=40686 RepID=A0A6N2K6A9_SALVM